MIESIYDDVLPIVEGIASDTARAYAKWGLDREDAVQECWVWVADHPKQIARWLEEEPEAWTRMLAKSLRRELRRYAENEKAGQLGYHYDDLVWYSKRQLGPLLEAMLNESAWIHPEVSGDENPRRGTSDPATGGNWIATLADVSQAFDRLDLEDRNILKMFHEPPVWLNKDAAKYLGLTEQLMSYRHDRALGRLLKELGGPRPRAQHDETCEHPFRGMGRRGVMSNSAARAMQTGYYDE